MERGVDVYLLYDTLEGLMSTIGIAPPEHKTQRVQRFAIKHFKYLCLKEKTSSFSHHKG